MIFVLVLHPRNPGVRAEAIQTGDEVPESTHDVDDKEDCESRNHEAKRALFYRQKVLELVHEFVI
jgi:hypothetical protein